MACTRLRMDFLPTGIVSSFSRWDGPGPLIWRFLFQSWPSAMGAQVSENCCVTRREMDQMGMKVAITCNHHTKQIIGGRSMTIPSSIWIIWFIYIYILYIYIYCIYIYIVYIYLYACIYSLYFNGLLSTYESGQHVRPFIGCTPGWALTNDQRWYLSTWRRFDSTADQRWGVTLGPQDRMKLVYNMLQQMQ